MIRFAIVLFFLVLKISCFGQFRVFFDEFDVTVKPTKKVDTVTVKLSGDFSGKTLRIYFSDFKGESRFDLFDKNDRLLITGNYINSIDTLVKYKFAKTIGASKGVSKYSVVVVRYFQPLKSGHWIYYDKNGEIKQEIEYQPWFY